MKITIVLVCGFIALVLIGKLWFSGGALQVAPSSSISADSSQGGDVAQVIQNLVKGAQAPAIVSDVWFNSPPLTTQDLRGKVVLVEFWTFDCINCRNVIPSVRDWHNKYHDQGLVVIGVHSPEFAHEKEVDGVKRAIKELDIPYPVAQDNDFKIWNSFKVYAWPSWFILDKQGRIRFTHIGEGAYQESEETIQQLLKEN